MTNRCDIGGEQGMAVQAGQGPLDYSIWDKTKEAYFGAIQAGLTGDYAPMKHLVEQACTR